LSAAVAWIHWPTRHQPTKGVFIGWVCKCRKPQQAKPVNMSDFIAEIAFIATFK
jgi:hypothetical protein